MIKVYFCHNNKYGDWVWSIIFHEEERGWIWDSNFFSTQEEAWDYCNKNKYTVVGCKLLEEL